MATGKLLFNWFDIALVLVIVFGLWRGRSHGMSKEFLPVTQWLVMILAAAFSYHPLGDRLIQLGYNRNVFGKNFNELTVAYLTSYLAVAIAVFIVFSFIKRAFKARIEGSNAFGSGEYYLGMISGAVRYLCMVIFALALLNAPYYSPADIIAAKAFSNREFGGGLSGFSGDFFPTLSETQVTIFKDSLAGPFLKSNLAVLLIDVKLANHEFKPFSQGETEIIQQRPH